MWVNILYIFAIVLGLTGCSFGLKTISNSGDNENCKNDTKILNDSLGKFKKYFVKNVIQKLTRKQIELKLKKIVPVTAKIDDEEFALCYAPNRRPHLRKAIYLCPICGNKTVHKGPGIELFNDITSIRRKVADIHGVNIGLNEETLCKSCSPEVDRTEIKLYINIEGENQIVEIINPSIYELNALKTFLDDVASNNNLNQDQTYLSDYYSRFIEFFNIKPSDSK